MNEEIVKRVPYLIQIETSMVSKSSIDLLWYYWDVTFETLQRWRQERLGVPVAATASPIYLAPWSSRRVPYLNSESG